MHCLAVFADNSFLSRREEGLRPDFTKSGPFRVGEGHLKKAARQERIRGRRIARIGNISCQIASATARHDGVTTSDQSIM
jgi:hypothetical protein